jgi:5-methylcytosine-specific restriction protein A
MARRALSVCSTPGCPTLTPGGRCEACQGAARRSRRTHTRAGYNQAWLRTRKAYLQAHPYCECSECADLPMPLRPTATEVDHVDGLGPLGPRGYDWANLRSMTKAHHARETARSQPGGWNDRG